MTHILKRKSQNVNQDLIQHFIYWMIYSFKKTTKVNII